MLKVKLPEIGAIAALLRHQLERLAIQVLCQIKGGNAQVQLESSAVEHVLPEMEGVHKAWLELPPPSIPCIQEHPPPLRRWQRTIACVAQSCHRSPAQSQGHCK